LLTLDLTYQMRSAHVSHEVDFDVTPSLKERMAHWDELEEGLEDDLFSLSPLTSPESSPTATPMLKTAELPAEILDLSQAIESLPSTAQERLKRHRLLQGRNNQAKRQRSDKLEERDGPLLRANANKKYAANSISHFTSTSATKSKIASTGYVGLNRCTEPKREYLLKELRKMGFDILKWDGR
jgi:hypothetical protein